MKIVSQLDDAGYFVGTAVADESPLEPGVFLLPRGCVDVPPPGQPPAGFRTRWSGMAWALDALPPPAEPGPEPDPADPVTACVNALQARMDSEAVAHRYDDLKTAITYRGDPNPRFAAEAEGFFLWRSAVWTDAYARLGRGDIPATPEAAVALMPPLVIKYP